MLRLSAATREVEFLFYGTNDADTGSYSVSLVVEHDCQVQWLDHQVEIDEETGELMYNFDFLADFC